MRFNLRSLIERMNVTDHDYYLLKVIEERPEISQRELADTLGISLGKVNYCIRALMEKGWIKARNFKNSTNKISYAYLLTPKGIASRSRLARKFLKRKIAEYERLESEIKALEQDLGIKK